MSTKKNALGIAQASFALLSLNHSLESGAEDDVLGVAGNGAFVLSPQERPVVEVLEVVRLAEQQSWCYIARDE